ncbi:FeS assembly SUF system protein [Chlamydia abortus]|uniref:Metal-sulfur cluster assembly factor n=1 Tax=Paenibacillus residui TaxID=629724 RepID=A0ABW3D6G6_9BACL|nr:MULTISPECIES: iron-sulfur cluster assembly protein [Paenibacillaceae]SHE14845.1 FeS assembly SUF system protein [Chlamydia abortus]
MDLKDKVWSVLEEVMDPELHINIVDLGLVYELEADPDGKVMITMTLTIPECPLKDELLSEIHEKVGAVSGVTDVEVNLVWEPKWTPARMSDQAIQEFKRRQTLV